MNCYHLYRVYLILFYFSSKKWVVFAFTTSTPSCHHLTLKLPPVTTRLQATSPSNTAAATAAVPLFSAISKTEEVTAIEAIFPFMNHIILTPYQLKRVIQSSTQDYSQVARIFLFATLGYFIPCIAKTFTTKIARRLNSKNDENDSNNYSYFGSNSYHITNHIRQGFYLGAVNNFVDCILDGAEKGSHVNTKLATILSNAFTSVGFTIWAMFRMRWYKNLMIRFGLNIWMTRRKNSMNVQKSENSNYCVNNIPNNNGLKMSFRLWKDVTDYILYIITGVVILNLMGVKYGIALRMISAFGTVGTLVVGLACREIASEIVSGILLASQRPFKLGDKILYGNNKKGTVIRMDLLYTIVKGSDEVRVKIPNSDLNYKTFSNLSRVQRSQVYQKLRFQYDTLDIMPDLVSAIKLEIIKSCPALITDGSSPWIVSFNSFEPGYLEVIVDARFRIKPDSEEYYQCKEDVLNAIGRAVKSCSVQFSD